MAFLGNLKFGKIQMLANILGFVIQNLTQYIHWQS